MFDTADSAIAMCTVRCHPDGGYTPVLHLSNKPAPVPTDTCISLPSPDRASQYARDHYGALPIVVAAECEPRHAA